MNSNSDQSKSGKDSFPHGSSIPLNDINDQQTDSKNTPYSSHDTNFDNNKLKANEHKIFLSELVLFIIICACVIYSLVFAIIYLADSKYNTIGYCYSTADGTYVYDSDICGYLNPKKTASIVLIIADVLECCSLGLGIFGLLKNKERIPIPLLASFFTGITGDILILMSIVLYSTYEAFGGVEIGFCVYLVIAIMTHLETVYHRRILRQLYPEKKLKPIFY